MIRPALLLLLCRLDAGAAPPDAGELFAPTSAPFGVHIRCAGLAPRAPDFPARMGAAFAAAARLGIPVASFDVAWRDYDTSTHPPPTARAAAERFAVEPLDAVLDAAAAHGVRVVLPLLSAAHGALPAWWPAYQDQRDAVQQFGHRPPGGPSGPAEDPLLASYDNPTHQELLQELAQRLVVRYRRHPALLAWSIQPGGLYETGYRQAHGAPEPDFTDYSPCARRRFQDWLSRRYADPAALNAAWGSACAAWSVVEPPLPQSLSASRVFEANGDTRPAMRDWQAYRLAALRNEWAFLCGLVRRLDPRHPLVGRLGWTPTTAENAAATMTLVATAVLGDDEVDAARFEVSAVPAPQPPQYLLEGNADGLRNAAGFCRAFDKACVVEVLRWDAAPPGPEIERGLAAAVRAGCSVWFPVALPDDPHPRAAWAWADVERLTRALRVPAGAPAARHQVTCCFDVNNWLSQYDTACGGSKAGVLYRDLARLFHEYAPDTEVGFASTPWAGALNPGRAAGRIAVLANQRVLDPDAVSNLAAFAAAGGTLLLVGANGVFDGQGRQDASALRTLAPMLTVEQVNRLYLWGLAAEPRLPVTVVQALETRSLDFPIPGNPAAHYTLLREALGESSFLAQRGEWNLTPCAAAPVAPPAGAAPGAPAAGAPPRERHFLRDFDRDQDGKVAGGEFPGPREVFQQLDQDHDGYVSADEAARDQGVLPPGPATGGPPTGRHDFIADFDRDRDGQVRREEFDGPPEIFQHLDADGDGTVTAAEFKQRAP